MKKTAALFCFLGAYLAGYGQQLEVLPVDAAIKGQAELSSLGITANAVYTFSEKGGRLFILDMGNKMKLMTSPISLGAMGLTESLCIEGMAFYGDHVFLADECTAGIYCTNLTGKFYQIIPKGADIARDKGDYGNEGITTDAKKQLCYLMKEYEDGNQSRLRIFKIGQENDQYTLTQLEEIIIHHEQPACGHWRYSDICYDAKARSLLCIRSYYRDSACAGYEIDAIKLKNDGTIGQKDINSKDFVNVQIPRTTLSALVLAEAKKHNASSNLEGITVNGDDIYIISDNYSGKSDEGKSTLFLKIKNGAAALH